MQQQPYRRGGSRGPSQVLATMQRGRSASGLNSADITRAAQRMMRASAPKSRPDRPARPDRPKRPAR